ncbi:MAG TPA: hypothetical protein VJA21_13420, partial [Verrucomicrobiae bacterium]
PHGLLLEWNSVIGEYYEVDFTPSLTPPVWSMVANGIIQATTPITTFEVPVPSGTNAAYRVVQIPASNLRAPALLIQLWTNNLVRISWPTAFPGETLQAAISPNGPWTNVNRPIGIEGGEFVVYDAIGTEPRFYRLIP